MPAEQSSRLRAVVGGRVERKSTPVACSVKEVDRESRNPLGEYLIPSSDSHGHSCVVPIRMSPTMRMEVGAVLESKKFPWDGPSAFLRWAVHRSLREVARMLKDPELNSLVAITDGWVAVARAQAEHARFQRVMEEVTGVVTMLLAQKAKGPARKIVKQIASQIEQLDDPYWHERYKRELVKRFGGETGLVRGLRLERGAQDDDE